MSREADVAGRATQNFRLPAAPNPARLPVHNAHIGVYLYKTVVRNIIILYTNATYRTTPPSRRAMYARRTVARFFLYLSLFHRTFVYLHIIYIILYCYSNSVAVFHTGPTRRTLQYTTMHTPT